MGARTPKSQNALGWEQKASRTHVSPVGGLTRLKKGREISDDRSTKRRAEKSEKEKSDVVPWMLRFRNLNPTILLSAPWSSQMTEVWLLEGLQTRQGSVVVVEALQFGQLARFRLALI